MTCRTSVLSRLTKIMKCKTGVLMCVAFWLPVGVASAAVLDYPVRPIRMVVPVTPGGATELVIRMVAAQLAERFGQQIVIDNRPGAGTVIGTDIVAKASPDGYTFLATTSSLTIIPSMHKKLPFDPIEDLDPVTMLSSFSFLVVVHPSVPANSVKEFIALAKAKPGVLNYASGGIGTPPHMGAELFKTMANIDVVHVPYKSAEATRELLAGQVQFYVGPFSTMMPYVKSGKLRALAVTSSERSSLLPELPTVAEAGLPGFEHSAWNGLLAPARTPPAIVKKLANEVAAMLKMPAISERFAANGVKPGGMSPEEFATLIKSQIAKWAKVVRQAGIKPR